MSREREYDAVIVGSGPNGLAAGIVLAQRGLSVLLIEGRSEIGGGMRSAELTLPGFTHDVCSAVHPLGAASPFMARLPLEEHGLKWIEPIVPVAHPLEDGTAVGLNRDIEQTSLDLGQDAGAYRWLMEPMARRWQDVLSTFLGPLRVPHDPLLMARFGVRGLPPAQALARHAFRGRRARALFAGLSAHAILPLTRLGTSAFGMMLGVLAHAVGWPLPKGGTGRLAEALARHFQALGGEIELNRMVASLDELPPARAILLDLAPAGLLRLAGQRLPQRYRRQLEKYRYGPGVFKLDLALDGPVPWLAEQCRNAGTVHVGGTLEEIAASEQAAFNGRHSSRPFVLVAQPSLFDATRAPPGRHTLWAYCHVPNGSDVDMSEALFSQIERFAPGFRDRILARHVMRAVDFERYNPNFVGGDINTGSQNLRQLFTRPTVQFDPYATPLKGVFLCSAATPPGGGVHGMCGYFAAQSALRSVLR